MVTFASRTAGWLSPTRRWRGDLEEVLRDCNPRQEHRLYRIPAGCRGYLEASISHWKGLAAQEAGDSAGAELGTLKRSSARIKSRELAAQQSSLPARRSPGG